MTRTRLMIQKTYLNKSWTVLASSGPMPSPGINVTVCQPPYLAKGGLCCKVWL